MPDVSSRPERSTWPLAVAGSGNPSRAPRWGLRNRTGGDYRAVVRRGGVPSHDDGPRLPAATPPIDPVEWRWLHDKYERLAAEEGQLSGSRTSYFATIGTVLITGLVLVLADFPTNHLVLGVGATFIASLGIIISSIWAVLLHRTNDAQALWREAAFRLEEMRPPSIRDIPAPITLRSGSLIPVDLSRPYTVHRERFSPARAIPWIDRLDPHAMTELLPRVFLVVWSVALVSVWVWAIVIT